jgi:hypothetical protein
MTWLGVQDMEMLIRQTSRKMSPCLHYATQTFWGSVLLRGYEPKSSEKKWRLVTKFSTFVVHCSSPAIFGSEVSLRKKLQSTLVLDVRLQTVRPAEIARSLGRSEIIIRSWRQPRASFPWPDVAAAVRTLIGKSISSLQVTPNAPLRLPSAGEGKVTLWYS